MNVLLTLLINECTVNICDFEVKLFLLYTDTTVTLASQMQTYGSH